MHPNVVLAVGAHPDDMDFGAGGTLATFAAQGADVYYLQLTDGGSGTDKPNITSTQLAALRRQEQEAACQLIGGKGVEFLDYGDGCLENTIDLKRQIVSVIRRLRPDVVITIDPTMVYAKTLGFINHPDHRAAGQATLDAVFPLARDHLTFPDLFFQGLKPHKVATVLLINFEDHNYVIDVSAAFDKRIAAAKAHHSQNGEGMAAMLTERSRAVGEQNGYTYAESFIRLDIAP